MEVDPTSSADAPLDKPNRRFRYSRAALLYLLAAVLLLVGAWIAYDGFKSNQAVETQAKRLSHEQSDSNGGDGSHPATTKPSAATIASYAVAPTLPRYIDIPKLSVHARVVGLSVTAENQLQSPANVYDAGWYTSSAQPGQPGATLLDGHISSWSTHGVFYGLNTLKRGDSLILTRGDGRTFRYQVVKTQLQDAKHVDMSSLLVSANTAKPGLNLISCAGEVIPGTSEFNKRIVVYAVLQ